MEMKLDFAISTALCMNFLHSSGLIHRDLKSLNLLVSKNYQVKICDFGLSRVIDSKSEMTKSTFPCAFLVVGPILTWWIVRYWYSGVDRP
jgi:serine/threonine protein kinase